MKKMIFLIAALVMLAASPMGAQTFSGLELGGSVQCTHQFRDLGFVNDSFMTGVGGKYSLTDKVDINFGYCYANYAPDNNTITSTRYERKTHNVSVGVDFRL